MAQSKCNTATQTVEKEMVSVKVPNVIGFKVEVLGGGRWMPAEDNGEEYYAIACSGCGCDVTSKGDPYRFCPWCGTELNQDEVRTFD